MAINKEYRQKAADLYKQDDITLKQYKAGLAALNKDKKDKLAALLTPRQKDQLAARRKRMDENRQVMQADIRAYLLIRPQRPEWGYAIRKGHKALMRQ